MPDILQSLRTKIEFVMICFALLGMMATGVFVYATQTSQLESHEFKIHKIEEKAGVQTTEIALLEKVITSSVIPSVNENTRDLVEQQSRLEQIERSSRVDREVLIEIRNDLKWLRNKTGEVEK